MFLARDLLLGDCCITCIFADDVSLGTEAGTSKGDWLRVDEFDFESGEIDEFEDERNCNLKLN